MNLNGLEPQSLPESIATERLLLKKHEQSLASQMFAAIEIDRARLRKFLPWVDLSSEEIDSYKYILSCQENWENQSRFDYGIFLKESGEYMGNVSLLSIGWRHYRAAFGYWILGKFEGKGYMTEAVKALEEVCFQIGFHRIEIRCSSENERSASIPKRLGYVLEGHLKEYSIVNGKFHDTLIYGKINPVKI